MPLLTVHLAGEDLLRLVAIGAAVVPGIASKAHREEGGGEPGGCSGARRHPPEGHLHVEVLGQAAAVQAALHQLGLL